MAQVKEGDTIRIHYVGKLEDGSVFDSSEGGASLEIKLGKGEFIKGLEEGVIGMEPGETREIFMTPDKAYGPHIQEKVFEFHKDRAPQDFNPEIGQKYSMYRADGMPVMVTVVDKTETGYLMDCNHPLAGKSLIFEVTLDEIVSEQV
jgi:FKBP-type peptidyl-prolyl cis-trans isomerase 2